MTKVYLEKDGNCYTVAANGHATGSSEVCTAVSTLFYMLAGYLRNAVDEPDFNGGIMTEKLESGNAIIRFFGDKKAETAFSMASVGFKQIEKKSPEFIKIEIQEII